MGQVTSTVSELGSTSVSPAQEDRQLGDYLLEVLLLATEHHLAEAGIQPLFGQCYSLVMVPK
jgi:hypothetical protein